MICVETRHNASLEGRRYFQFIAPGQRPHKQLEAKHSISMRDDANDYGVSALSCFAVQHLSPWQDLNSTHMTGIHFPRISRPLKQDENLRNAKPSEE